jgi:hypothetical protein
MKNIFRKYFLLILISLLFWGCKKEFLDVKPIGIINSSSFYATKSDAESAVTSVYGMLNYMQVWDMWIMADLGSVTSDDAEAGGATPQDVPDWQNYDNFTFDASQPGGFAQAYGVLYKMIFFANIALERLPEIPKKDTTATQDFINQRLGEVKFLRAFDYLYLVQIFGEVPLVDHVLGATEYAVYRSSLKSVFKLIETDLQDAIAVLPASYSGTDLGRATKGAAQALLAKAYLFESSYAHYYPGDNYSLVNNGESRFKDLQEKWTDALTMAENVISSGQYNLVGNAGEKYTSWRGSTDGFRYIWTTDGENSKESVFEIQAEYLGLNWLLTRGSSMAWWTGARWIYDYKTQKPTETKYWGFNIPSLSLLTEFNQEKRQPGDPLIDSLTPADPRFNTTIHRDTSGGNDSVNVQGAKIWSKISYQFNATQRVLTNMYQAKYECSYGEFLAQNANWSESPFNNRMIRYADVVLFAAEAAIMLGNTDKALTYINMVRTRARMCGALNNTAPANLALGDLTSTLNTPNGSVAVKLGLPQLIHERRLELAMEGFRFYDLVRWNLAIKYLPGQYLVNQNKTVGFTSPKNDFFPIPQAEVNTSQGHLLQYSGW